MVQLGAYTSTLLTVDQEQPKQQSAYTESLDIGSVHSFFDKVNLVGAVFELDR